MVEVKIGGKKRKFSYGLEAIGWVQVEAGIDLTNPREGLNETSLFYILIKYVILLGNKWELKKEGKQIDYNYDDVEDWIKETGVMGKEVITIWNEFNESISSYMPQQEEVDDKPKKK